MGTANSNKNTLYPNAMIQPRLFARLVFVLILIGIILLYCYGSSQQQRQAIVPTANKSLNLTAVIGMSTSQTDTQFLSFTVKLGDDVDNAEQQQQQQQREPAEEEENSSRYYYQCVMPLPPSTSLSRYQHHQVTPLAKLDIQFPYPVNFTHFDFKCPLMNLSGWQDSLEESEEEKLDSKSPLPASASNNNNKASSSSSSNRERNNNSSPPPLSPKVRGYWERLYHTTNYLFDHQSKILKLMFKGK
ncbi:hypothetical protein BDB00DRAFT_850100 [Zychaea mexicana]|uniref:uncharacterized protein n=1 Tax=Zychaea mexicana TaxID=64656 RepID=UPI0022FECB96|nr:uncharacterized protein BDB00DRAFT_860374 [Zychaea mexicana]XP_052974379.1 uncharacterized protein BDB00DRAFT_850100 [Zychaea mexicana]KAI9474832.1 hypothetical protein BDB00DRAFT_860374 [Zychaea mexicana]KAI9488114.1 hypothetical protein BDB00DRAFT_850100 [Zychaea mexicana]